MVVNANTKPSKHSSYDINEGVLSVKIRYAIKRGKRWHLQLPVPKDLQSHYNGSLIKRSLGTGSVFDAAKAVSHLYAAYASEFEQLKDGKISQSVLSTKPTEALLSFISGIDSGRDIASFMASMADPSATELTVNSYVPPVADPDDPNSYRLSDLTELYLDNHRGPSDKLIRDTIYTFNAFIDVVGNKRLSDVSRADVHAYRDSLIGIGNKTATIRKRMGYVSAVFSVALRELEMDKANPALAVQIRGEGGDKVKRIPARVTELQKLRPLIESQPDDLRLILGMLFDTGCRLAEIVGIKLDDIKLGEEIPYIILRSHASRRLKTASSTREVPLVGFSLWCARKTVALNKGREFAFPSYCSASKIRSNSASAALIKWIKKRGVDKTPHELRHGWADRLRETGCSPEIRKALGGWSIGGIAAEYGEGYSLKVKHEALRKIADY